MYMLVEVPTGSREAAGKQLFDELANTPCSVPMQRELLPLEEEWLDDAEPTHVIDLAHMPFGVEKLYVYYFTGFTIVETVGEEQNGDPWAYACELPPLAVLADFLLMHIEE